MLMLVPNTKTELILKAPWTFRLYNERRNSGLAESMGVTFPDWATVDGRRDYRAGPPFTMVTLPTGTVLKVSRVYIRQGTTDSYDSLTFTVRRTTARGQTNKAVKGRFWAKLGDINGKMDADAYFGETTTKEEQMSRFALLFED